MKSNKFLLAIAAMAAVSMSSCSQEEELVVPDNQLSENAVVFGTYIGASRATVMDLTALQSKGFGVMAYYTKGENFGTKSTPNFMYNQQVTYTDGAWTYTPLKYWPNNSGDKLSFFAYAPYIGIFEDTNITALSGNDAEGDPTLSFVMDADVSKQIDLLYADAVKDQTKPGVESKVTFNFKHALSRVNFSRQLLIDNNTNTSLDAATTITINEVKFSAMSFGTSGTLNLADGTWSGVNGTGASYVLSGDKLANVELKGDEATKEESLTPDKGYIMFIPSASSESTGDNTIYIKYTVKTTDDKLALGYSEIVNERTITVPNTVIFEKGKAYNFVLKIGLTSVKVEAFVADWPTDETTPKWESIEIEF